jgi:hypothetical protein
MTTATRLAPRKPRAAAAKPARAAAAPAAKASHADPLMSSDYRVRLAARIASFRGRVRAADAPFLSEEELLALGGDDDAR